MFTVTINGNSIEELFNNIKIMLQTRPEAAAQNAQPGPAPAQPFAPPLNFNQTPAQTVEPVAPIPPAYPSAPAPAIPTAAPSYTLDQLAQAGAALAQSGKTEQAVALLARYGVQSISQLPPEQYGAFATELRALGTPI